MGMLIVHHFVFRHDYHILHIFEYYMKNFSHAFGTIMFSRSSRKYDMPSGIFDFNCDLIYDNMHTLNSDRLTGHEDEH